MSKLTRIQHYDHAIFLLLSHPVKITPVMNGKGQSLFFWMIFLCGGLSTATCVSIVTPENYETRGYIPRNGETEVVVMSVPKCTGILHSNAVSWPYKLYITVDIPADFDSQNHGSGLTATTSGISIFLVRYM